MGPVLYPENHQFCNPFWKDSKRAVALNGLSNVCVQSVKASKAFLLCLIAYTLEKKSLPKILHKFYISFTCFTNSFRYSFEIFTFLLFFPLTFYIL